MQKFEEARNSSNNTGKKVLELTEPSIQMLEGSFYWIAGPEDIFQLNHKRKIGDSYTRKLGAEEIMTLPVDIVYVGDEEPGHYLDDEEEAFARLVKIIENMNMMQDKNFVSFPLGTTLKLLQEMFGFICRTPNLRELS